MHCDCVFLRIYLCFVKQYNTQYALIYIRHTFVHVNGASLDTFAHSSMYLCIVRNGYFTK